MEPFFFFFFVSFWNHSLECKKYYQMTARVNCFSSSIKHSIKRTYFAWLMRKNLNLIRYVNFSIICRILFSSLCLHQSNLYINALSNLLFLELHQTVPNLFFLFFFFLNELRFGCYCDWRVKFYTRSMISHYFAAWLEKARHNYDIIRIFVLNQKQTEKRKTIKSTFFLICFFHPNSSVY